MRIFDINFLHIPTFFLERERERERFSHVVSYARNILNIEPISKVTNGEKPPYNKIYNKTLSPHLCGRAGFCAFARMTANDGKTE